MAVFHRLLVLLLACLPVSLDASALSGRVLRLGGSRPVPFAEVFAYASPSAAAAGLLAQAGAGAAGEWSLASLSTTATVWVRASAAGYLPGQPQPVSPDGASLDLYLLPLSFDSGEVVVHGRRRPPQASEFDLSAQESRRVPGSSSDPVRAVGALPGVAVVNDYLANLMVQGGRYNDNLVLLDGFPASYPFHFGGLESVFPAAALSSVALLGSGFDARYGDKQGGVLEMESKPPEEGLHGEADASMILLGAQAAYGGGRASAFASYRRGFFDLVVPPHPELTEVPRYADYLAEARFPLSKDADLLLEAFGSQDSTAFYNPQSQQPFGWDSYFHTAGARLTTKPWENWTFVSLASASLSQTKIDLQDLYLDERPYEWYLRQEAEYLLQETQELDAGLEWHETRTMLNANFPRIPAELGGEFAFNSLPVVSVDALGSKNVYSAWVQDRWHALDSLWMSAGARFDWVDLHQEFFLSPRMALEWNYDERTTWKASVGDYFQSLDPLETVPGWSANPLRSEDAKVWSFSFEKRPLPGQVFKAEYYHKEFTRFIPGVLVDVSGGTVEAAGDTRVVLNSVPTGFADGLELSWRILPVGGFFGWVSYGYSYVERSQGQGFYEADFDQPHSVQLVLNYSLTPRWEVGLRQKVASGIPYTPLIGRSFDSSTGQWTPVFGATNSQHLDWYHRLDLRTQYTFLMKGWSLRLFAEVINAYDQPNVSSVTYNSDYSALQLIKQLPRIYFAGVEGEF